MDDDMTKAILIGLGGALYREPVEIRVDEAMALDRALHAVYTLGKIRGLCARPYDVLVEDGQEVPVVKVSDLLALVEQKA